MNKKGFISIYGIVLMNLILPFCLMVIESVKTSYLYRGDVLLDFAEIHTINKVKQDLLNYEEENESYHYMNYAIELVYDDITCSITIFKEAEIMLRSQLEFDDINEEIVSYTYLSKNGA